MEPTRSTATQVELNEQMYEEGKEYDMYIIHYTTPEYECWHKEPTIRKVKNFIRKYKHLIHILDVEFVLQEEEYENKI